MITVEEAEKIIQSKRLKISGIEEISLKCLGKSSCKDNIIADRDLPLRLTALQWME